MAQPIGLDGLKAKLVELRDRKILVGVVGDNATRLHPNGNGETIGQVGKWMEFGTEQIDKRPFVHEGIARLRKTDKIKASLKKAVSAIVDGRAQTPEAALESLGDNAVNYVREAIDVSYEWAKDNAESTEKKKGFNHPLIDTGALRDAVNFKVVKK